MWLHFLKAVYVCVGENEPCTQNRLMGDLRLRQVSQEDKQKSAREEKKCLQLVGQRAPIQIGGIRVREM